MSNEQTWSDEAIEEIVEKIMGYKETGAYVRAHQAMALMRQVRDELIAELIAERDALAAKIERARTYTGVEAHACPLCRYEDGVFVEPCEMHRQIDALAAELAAVRAERDEWVQNVNELDSSLAQSTYATDDLREQLEALRAEPRYVPVEDGEYEGQHRDNTIYVDGEWLKVKDPDWNGGAGADIALLDDMRLCRLVPGQDAQPELTEAEIDDLLLDADNAMRERARQRATDAQHAAPQASSDVDRG